MWKMIVKKWKNAGINVYVYSNEKQDWKKIKLQAMQKKKKEIPFGNNEIKLTEEEEKQIAQQEIY